MNIEIISTKVGTGMDKNQRPYQFAEVVYYGPGREGKNEVKAKKIMGFNKNVFDTVATAKQGEFYSVDQEKNSGGFLEWTAIHRTSNSAEVGAQTVGNGPDNPATGSDRPYTPKTTTSPKSTYETPEERARRQVLIVRQSSVSSAIAILSTGVKTPPDLGTVLSYAKEIEKFVMHDGVENTLASMKEDYPFVSTGEAAHAIPEVD